MHPSSVENMRVVKEKYLQHINASSIVLDVGGRGLDSDRSYRQHFPDSIYHIADIQEGLNVTHVMPGPYTLPFADNSIDLVVSGQMLEHSSNPFKSIAEMNRVLKPGGYMAIIAPSAGPYHDSQDGWRFLKDAFRFIAEDVGNLEIVADWITTNAPDARSRKWQDHVFVGKKI